MSDKGKDTNVHQVAFGQTEIQQFLDEVAKLSPVGVAVIIQTEEDQRAVATTYRGIDPAALQYGIRMLQLQADQEILDILDGGEDG